MDNHAVDVLNAAEAEKVRARLRATGQMNLIMIDPPLCHDGQA